MKIFSIKDLNTNGKIIFKNFSYFSLLRVFNVLSQYILVSYLVRVLGGDTYGYFVWAFSVIQYLVIIVHFGFNTYAAKYIADNRSDPQELNRIISAILRIKLTFFVFTAILFLLLTQVVPVFRERADLLVVLLLFVLGEALFPIWFFQGKENLRTPTLIVFSFKFMLVLLTFLLINQPEHVFRYAILLSSSQFLIGFIGTYLVVRDPDFSFVRVTTAYLRQKLKDGFMFFVGNFFSKTFNLSVIFLTGLLFAMEDVAGFDISFKIVAAFQLPLETLSMALFPTIARTRDLKMNQKITFMAALSSLLIWAFVYWQSELLLRILGGDEMIIYTNLLRELSVLIPIVVITYFLGTNTLVAFGYQRAFNLSIIYPSIIYLVLLFVFWQTDGLTIQMIIFLRILVDVLMMGYRLFIAFKYKLIFMAR